MSNVRPHVMLREFLLRVAEVAFSAIFLAAAMYPTSLGYSFVACGSEPASWALVLFLILPLQFPAIGVAWAGLSVGVAFAAKPLHSIRSIRRLLKWCVPASLGFGILVTLVAAALKVHEKCNFGF